MKLAGSLMQEKRALFARLLELLHSSGILSHIILIGSWCQLIYKHYFPNPPEIPALRTTDVDFLIPYLKKITLKIDIPQLLSQMGFEQEFSPMHGYSKFVHPDLEVEFLTPEIGRPNDTPYTVKNLNITAQRLRFLSILQEHTLTVNYNNLPITVPQPAAFVLHKFLITKRRNKPAKAEKDATVATQIGEYLLTLPKQKKLLASIFLTFKPKWQKTVLDSCQETSEALYDFLKNIY
jgi:hypothetical protein